MEKVADKVFTGKVIWFSNKKGFGFIEWSDNSSHQEDMFVHFSDVNCAGYKTLNKDQVVNFKIGSNRNGAPKAIEVVVVE